MTNENNTLLIKDSIGEPAVYEQLAEECTELAKEALKMARYLRGENPTPCTKDVILDNLTEEFTDVMLCSCELGLHVDYATFLRKHQRWRQRINDRKQGLLWKDKFEKIEASINQKE